MTRAVEPDAAVATFGLTKRFGPKIAVADVTLQIPPGSFFGLVGPNGAGKTTLLSMMTGLLRPDDGRVSVAGHDVWADPAVVKTQIGILPEGLRLLDRLSGWELLMFTGRLRGMPQAQIRARAEQLLATLGLTPSDASTLIVDYSTGMRKKIGLAAALLHNPRVLFLDEPFEGVDPIAAEVIRGVLAAYTRSGSTVIFSSHVLELVANLCDWVGVMSFGRILAAGPLSQVTGGRPLQRAFLDIVGAQPELLTGGLPWLGSSSG